MELVELTGPHTDEERAQLVDGEENPFADAHLTLPPGRPVERRFALRDEGRLIASAGLVVVEVEVERRTFAVVGFGGVLVTHSRRGEGLFRRVMEPALQAAHQLGPDFALLFCLRKNAHLYAKLGFARVTAPVTVAGVDMPLDTMWRALTAQAAWPDGPVTIPGPMF